MTSRDVHDVLNLPSDHSGAPRPSKKQKTSAPRPNLKGLAREVQNLGGDNPIAIVPEVNFFKKRRFATRKPVAKWELKAFTNSARGDDGALVLRHWKRRTDDGAPPVEGAQDGDGQQQRGGGEGTPASERREEKPEDSAFAKYNVKVVVPHYTEDQYHSNLQNNDWTKEETDYLLELAKDFDLRWTLIWDRYDFTPKPPGGGGDAANGEDTSTAVVPAPKQRSMEDLKARYYEVAAKMMAVQKPAQYMTRPEFELYEMMQNFDPEQERKRKQFALNTLSRSKDEAREEESLLLEVKRILARTERFNEERRELYNRLDYPATDSDINSFKTSAGLQNLLQTLMSTDKNKKRKSIMPGEGVSPSNNSGVPNSAVSETNPANRRESIAASATSNNHHHHARRDSDARTPATPADPTPTSAAAAAANKKKGGGAQQQPERRKLTQQEEQVYGVSYHDRLGSGPTFRYEKINKLYSHKSGQQQLRITNALSELDLPPRLVMPTAAVTAQFEVLWGAVTALVDLRKMSDRLDGEIKIEEAKKAERDRAKGIAAEKEGGKEKGEGGGGGGGDGAAAAAGEGEKAGEKTGEGGQTKEDGEKKRPGSSGSLTAAGHKRSASVLSAASDKSSKRQKK
ncbi:uncharacterized protein PODANS_4_2520 [Podospora anserina S mat+]|uniref:SWR1-complex protein 4 n=1 Tax=Podospora anserina (strain S / ATCC MYA-4624 / DSM 980 / FGSC 10383) TaxID=515849 RepID=B2AE14_PODAN|nr:uncharacterized protein PODANS_4_2520 [Podospora anserina S mat+]CAP61679.1 unnamed protein product [Podospora anserina S mat+]CDP28030.1 Putative SWR1-complex protein 4 [Podospora anserina S mat+]